MEKKYEMIPDGKYFTIRALRDFGDVHKGDAGGFIQSEKNLSHEGNCWIERDAYVLENAVVSENAIVETGGLVKGNAQIRGNARVQSALVTGNAILKGNAQIACDARIKDEAYIGGNAVVCCAHILGKSEIGGEAFLVGYGYLKDAFVYRRTDTVFVNGLGCHGNTLAFYTCKDNKDKLRIVVCDRVKCLTLDKFEEYISQTLCTDNSVDSFYVKTYKMAAEMAKFQIVEGYKAAKKENNPIKMVKASSTQKVGEAVSSENLEKTA